MVPPRPSNCDFAYRPPFRDPRQGRTFVPVAHFTDIATNRRAAEGRDFYTDDALKEATQPDYEAALGCPSWERADLREALERTVPVAPDAALADGHLRAYDDVVKALAVRVRGSREVTRHGDHAPRLAFDRLLGMRLEPGKARWVLAVEAVFVRTGKLYGSCVQAVAELNAGAGRGARFLAVRHLGAVPTDQTVPGVEAWDPGALPCTRVFKTVGDPPVM